MCRHIWRTVNLLAVLRHSEKEQIGGMVIFQKFLKLFFFFQKTDSHTEAAVIVRVVFSTKLDCERKLK